MPNLPAPPAERPKGVQERLRGRPFPLLALFAVSPTWRRRVKGMRSRLLVLPSEPHCPARIGRWAS